MWITSQTLHKVLLCIIKWAWVKGYQVQRLRDKRKVDVVLNDIYDRKAESARALQQLGDEDTFIQIKNVVL